MIPYSRQSIDEDDIKAVIEVLRSDYLTTGPKIDEFEQEFARRLGAQYAVAVSSGTAALHAAMFALGIGPGDEVIVPAMTFAASANCVVFQRGTPVFVDVDPTTLLIDASDIPSKITKRTKAIIAVDYTGHPCDYDALDALAQSYGLTVVADACHSLGAVFKGKAVGCLAVLNAFSFHPVKHIATGEGGMVTTHSEELAQRMRVFRNHGITSGFRERQLQGSWTYEMTELGYNYRLTDIQCALGISQLRRLEDWLMRRREIAHRYLQAFADIPEVNPLGVAPSVSHAYHLFVVRFSSGSLKRTRKDIFEALRDQGIGVNVHYIPVHLHPFYRRTFGTTSGQCPVAEEAYEKIISLPLFPAMKDEDVEGVIEAVRRVLGCEHKHGGV